ncbi:hypothetical protein PIB30_066969 [Stylosanthes scabra]|uniref:RRM domain-containing protein n=1 Tax=Stylosanthes scabra TaxID=79078 RepID=A0ABU6WQB5_9FABA|nr:hypothetical protein [Stylosanthes scabra]
MRAKRIDVRRVEGSEWEKHGKGSGYAGRRNKRESAGGRAFGVWRVNRNKDESANPNVQDCNAGFVDNLPLKVTKREIYKRFRRNGYITDIFISRKLRKNAIGPFAFVRFHSYEGAAKAITTINGTIWDDAKLYVTMARSKRIGNSERTQERYVKQQGTNSGIQKKWVAIGAKTKDRQTEHSDRCCNSMKCRTKEVEALWCAEQKQRLQRSLLGVSVKPIYFRKVMYKLMDEWKGPGKIECRDVGPFRCLLTFDTTEIRDAALEDELL